MDVFFYGTLLDEDVRRLVLGPAAGGMTLEPAGLRGFRRMAKLDSTAPVITPRSGASVDGLLARQLSRAAMTRLRHYEGRNYRLCLCKVTTARGITVPALVFCAAGRIPTRRHEWRLAPWQRRHKRRFLGLMRLWMSAYREAAYLAQRRPRWIMRWAARE